ncbi:mitochondrial 37S ribosomal protein bS6m MRP17 PWA37_003023 [Arxiozyma heterogenica]|uniref:Uncharacterized protein n=1 Tax=Arxiozyma heterogenica TaxID=278026 RepID=A0AAN7WFS2_9SACH|nr:hypothetical protein RI543_005188 [Kazachstania heterogenica]
MLYELMGIVRVTNTLQGPVEAKELLTSIGKTILSNRGLIRSIIPIGIEQFSSVLKKNQTKYYRGYRFVMLFDSSVGVQSEINRILKKDPRLIRSSIVKINTKRNLDIASSLDRIQSYNSILQKVGSNNI